MYNDCEDFNGKSLSSLILFLTEWQFELISENPGKSLRIKIENEMDEPFLGVEVCHIESDEERDARIEKLELEAETMMRKFGRLPTI